MCNEGRAEGDVLGAMPPSTRRKFVAMTGSAALARALDSRPGENDGGK